MGPKYVGHGVRHRWRGLEDKFGFAAGFRDCRGFAWSGRVFEVGGETCRGLRLLLFPGVTGALTCTAAGDVRFLQGRVDGWTMGRVVQTETDVDVEGTPAVIRWDLKVKRVLATWVAVLLY